MDEQVVPDEKVCDVRGDEERSCPEYATPPVDTQPGLRQACNPIDLRRQRDHGKWDECIFAHENPRPL